MIFGNAELSYKTADIGAHRKLRNHVILVRRRQARILGAERLPPKPAADGFQN
jgi:hypothetical protein